MKQADFIQALSEKINQSKKDTKFFIDEFIALIAKTVKSGDEVALPDLGKFFLRKTAAREARNPMTGATVKVPAKVVAKFRPSKKFKEEILGAKPSKK